jgi:hypothetical protein
MMLQRKPGKPLIIYHNESQYFNNSEIGVKYARSEVLTGMTTTIVFYDVFW